MKRYFFLLLSMILFGVAATGAQVIKNKTFVDQSYRNVKTVKVVQTALDVRIARGAGDNTAVKCHVNTMETSDPDYAVEARLVGSTLEIYERKSSQRWGSSFSRVDGYIAIAVPEHVQVISVSSVSGDVSLRDCEVENLSLKTVSGDVCLENIVSSLAVASTVSGDVSLRAARGNKITVNTVSGDILGKEGASPAVDFALVSLGSTSGDVYVQIGPSVKQTAFKSVSGDLRLCFKGDLMRNAYTLGAVSGDIVVSSYAKARRKLEIQPENPLVDVRANTVSGDIYVLNY